MSELYLIAHKVRGEPAFDVATQMECPLCHGAGTDTIAASEQVITCHECDSLGYWWIILTSGHRAYPIMHWSLNDLYDGDCSVLTEAGPLTEHPLWSQTPDHYTTRAAPRIDLATALGIKAPTVTLPPLPRRL